MSFYLGSLVAAIAMIIFVTTWSMISLYKKGLQDNHDLQRTAYAGVASLFTAFLLWPSVDTATSSILGKAALLLFAFALPNASLCVLTWLLSWLLSGPKKGNPQPAVETGGVEDRRRIAGVNAVRGCALTVLENAFKYQRSQDKSHWRTSILKGLGILSGLLTSFHPNQKATLKEALSWSEKNRNDPRVREELNIVIAGLREVATTTASERDKQKWELLIMLIEVVEEV